MTPVPPEREAVPQAEPAGGSSSGLEMAPAAETQLLAHARGSVSPGDAASRG